APTLPTRLWLGPRLGGGWVKKERSSGSKVSRESVTRAARAKAMRPTNSAPRPVEPLLPRAIDRLLRKVKVGYPVGQRPARIIAYLKALKSLRLAGSGPSRVASPGPRPWARSRVLSGRVG